MALCSLYGPLSPLRPSAPSTVLCPLDDPLSTLRLSVPSTALCPLYSSLSLLLPTVLSTALYLLYNYLSPLHPYVLSSAFFPPLQYFVPYMALCSLYGPLPLRPSILRGVTLCFLNSPLSSLLPSASSTALIPSMAICPL
jgi:hypothetical protein